MEPLRNLKIKQYQELFIKELNDIDDFNLLILKGHILVEYIINLYLESLSNKKEPDFFKENYTFSLKLGLLKHFGNIGGELINLYEELHLLNKLRNDIAHKLQYQERHLTDFYTHLSKKELIFKNNDFDNELEKFKHAIFFLLGIFVAAYVQNVDKTDYDNYS
ncbi:hypothetical protein OA93_23280 [Flavobacterium sp. KMS]|uniref:hypothetical protein n=1 Tax=Flavobacterium sp. KMS TaxID=1566023 RepID=UPI00057F15A7|nr:hypothetical protein [Flavobacterium sp. KMS]KIA92462.1 hypothetical protein OA93_23280 [Flavobacterium sp. KMS]